MRSGARPQEAISWIGRLGTSHAIVRNVLSVASQSLGAIVEALGTVASLPDLRLLLTDVCAELGYTRFALAHHVDLRSAPGEVISVHNYPVELERLHATERLGSSDPVHRACQRTPVGFRWSDLQRIVELSHRDQRVLRAAADHGIVDGFTVPVHVPGEFSGSCTFAGERQAHIEPGTVAVAQLVGTLAFEAARRVSGLPNYVGSGNVHLSDRQRECLVWIGRGKCNSEIGTILGISTHTVNQYVKHALAAFDVVSRSQLVGQALRTGAISFLDLGQ